MRIDAMDTTEVGTMDTTGVVTLCLPYLDCTM